VADGAMQNDLTVPAQAQLDRRVNSRRVVELDQLPDVFREIGGQPDGLWVDLVRFPDRGDLRQVRRYAALGREKIQRLAPSS
jgi:hypothetical protein